MQKIVRGVAFMATIMLMLAVWTPASATVWVNPDTGGDYSFLWKDGLGSNPWAIQDITNNTWYVNESSWSLALAADSNLSFITAWDGFIPGDAFQLQIDNQAYAWENAFVDNSGYYHGEAEDIFLAAGVHSISIYVSAVVPGFEHGQGFLSIGSVSDVAPVPEPATMLLFGTGLAGLAGRSLRRKKSA